MELAYLFECHFTDGTMIQQTKEDVSAIDPTKSTFYDVDQRIADVAFFGIYNDNHSYVVDLKDGHFEVDGATFFLPLEDELPADTTRELVYFRRHQHVTAMGQSLPESLSHTVAFHFGWKATVNEKEIRQTIIVS